MSLKVYINLMMTTIVFLAFTGCQEKEPPYSPERALSTFELPEGFRLELVAAEPLIREPVDLTFDADGRLYVVEMPDYPAEDDKTPLSKIILLEDGNGDGMYDTRTVFADNLSFVNGVMPWRNGILATNAPDIIYFEDTTGDGHADIQRIVLTGFAATNPQLRMGNLRYGLDNWIYGAYSRAGGSRRYPQFADQGHPLTFPENPVADSAHIYPGTNFRFRPDEFIVEPSGGMSQFGLSLDVAGNQFTVWNNDHLRHVVLPYRYLTKNPFLSINSVMTSIPDHGGAATVYPITEDLFFVYESEIGHFTSACGISIYTGDIFPANYQNAAFVCEPVHGLVHADILSAKGATFVASRAQIESEFLASTDSWFKPVNTRIGPDGALYIADMYRKLVEHPAFIAGQAPFVDDDGTFNFYTHGGILQESEFYKGRDYGRIYRLVPEDFKNRELMRPNLSGADMETLVGHLAHPNMWWRLTAQRLLIDRSDLSVIPKLEVLFTESTSSFGKIHALWTLEGLDNLDDRLVLSALEDESSIVRKQAVVLAESRLENGAIKEKLLEMTDDPQDHVQFQVALSLSALSNAQTFESLKQLAMQHLDDSWFQNAILLSASENSLQWYQAVGRFETPGEKEVQGKEEYLGKIASITSARSDAQEISELVSLIEQEQEVSFQVASLNGLMDGLQRGGDQLQLSQRGQNKLLGLITGASSDVQTVALEVASYIDMVNSQDLQHAVNQALEVVLDEDSSIEERAHATQVLGLHPAGLRIEILEELLAPQQPIQVQMAAARVLLRSEDSRAIQLLIDRWDSYTSGVREIVESGILGRRDHVVYLLEAIEERDIEPSSLRPSSRTKLAQHPNEEIQRRAEIVFSELLEVETREQVILEYFEATTLEGELERDISNGKEVFKKSCSTCHQLDGIGHPVGPDMRSVTSQPRINLLTMILDPNNDITPGYEGYVVQTREGRTYSGVMVRESSTGVVLRMPGGEELTIPRDNIESAQPMASSVMPEGLESSLSIQDMADLIEYIKSLK